MKELINVVSLTHEDVVANHPELLAREVELEEEAASIAKELIEKNVERRGLVEGSAVVRQTLRDLVMSTSNEIDRWLDSQAKTRRKSVVVKHISILSSEQLSYIVARELLNVATKGEVGFTNACAKVGEAVRKVVEYALFSEANGGLAATIEQQLRTSSSPRHNQAVFRSAMRSAGFEGMKWDVEQKAAVGHILVSAFMDATGLFEKVISKVNNHSTTRLATTDLMGDLLADADVFDSLLMPYHYPMIIPPKPWVDLHDGGYVNQQQHQLSMVKAKSRASMAHLEASDLDSVAAAINSIQATPWRINSDVLEVFTILNESGTGEAGLASSVQPDLPTKPWGVLDAESWAEWKADESNLPILKEWKNKASDAYRARTVWASARLVQDQQRKLADRFEDEPCIYFPHTVDFRGRVYPAAGLGAVNPQGNDAGKGLLEFARGKALGKNGAKWLAVHVANTWGADKISLADRELWAQLNEDNIVDTVLDPISNTWWMDADKPFCFLAACFEWYGYLVEGDAFVSRLPIAMDGSCSGLQHFAAMLHCEKTARAVNVIQSGDTPEDLYTVVLKEVTRVLELSTDTLTGEWLPRLHRDITKQPCMTTAYGVTSRGVISQIADNAKKLIKRGKIAAFAEKTPFEAATFLAPLVVDAIRAEAAAAVLAMDWLKGVAKICSKADHPIHWETAVGFTAIQDYRKSSGRQIQVKWGGKTHKLTVQKTGGKLDGGKQASGLAPNFVHSWDAAHLMITVNNCDDQGLRDFAMIHDSFAVHACDTGLLNEVLRECFIEMYKGDTLNDFYMQLGEQLPIDVWVTIPRPPAQGTLDLSLVRESEFFFS